MPSKHTLDSRTVRSRGQASWDTLPLRLGVLINVTVILVVGTFWIIDTRRERALHLREQADVLREEAKVLRVARSRLDSIDAFQGFVDDFCAQMDSAASPGHHILVFGGGGHVIVRAHQRANPALEARMVSGGHGRITRFMHRGDNYLAVHLDSGDEETIVVTQSLAPIEKIMRAQAISRAMSMGTLVVLISVVTSIALLAWVRSPLRKLVGGIAAISRRDFSVRVPPSGSRELRYLATGVNEMADALEKVEALREAEMARARAIQRSLLPGDGQMITGYELATTFLPADSVGGDLYDVIELPDGSFLVVVFDVSGHGVPAALYTALLRTCLRHHAALTSDSSCIAKALNAELRELAASETFATCYLARLIPSTGQVEYIGAGHEPAVVIRTNGQTETLDGVDLPFGVDGSKSAYQAMQSILAPGDRLYIFTDGLHEVFDEDGELFGRDRLKHLLVETSKMSPDGQIGMVVQTVRSFQKAPQFEDDITLLCLLRKGKDVI